MALEYVKAEVNKREIKQLSVLSDSQSAKKDKGIKSEIIWTKQGAVELEEIPEVTEAIIILDVKAAISES